ncbi:hypothetical protein [Cryobacterium cryoconiti]|uniref:Uncharacterized protein n=1 Tax=Cryobacterium cryoconiti TaxID=1259239 RepID=A0A4Y8JT35_9MICO|nr:hypothetical protein [Cryobacterium cryoconiti]TFD28359.1 hypothetical protein E3T49_11845 [Cryobacterium cryoconiti]
MIDNGVSRVGKVLSGAVLVVGAVFLTACSGPAAPIPRTPSPTATPETATATATESAPPAAARVTDLVLSSTSIEFRDASGTAQSTFDYFQPPDELVSALTLALGSAPTESTWGEDDNHPGVTYAWDDFAIHDFDRVVNGETLNCPSSSFGVETEALNGVRIRTVDGIAVGDNAAEIAARYPDTSWRSAPLGDPKGEPVELHIGVGHVSLPPCEAARGNSDRTYSVRLDAPDPLGPITRFWGPSADWGD